MTSPVTTRAPRTAPAHARSGRPEPRRTPQPAPAPRPDLRVVREAPSGRRTGLILVAAGAVIFASLLASAFFHSVLVTGQDDLDQIDKAIIDERADLQRARLALADAQSPERIAAAATSLGMVRADEQTWLSPDSGAEPVVIRSPGADQVSEDDGAPETATGDDDADSTTSEPEQPDPGANGAAR